MYGTKILIVDDERENVRYLQTVLEENGFKELYEAYDGEEGFSKVKEIRPGLILLDLRMPKKSGIWMFNELKKSEEFKDIPVVILTGEGGFLRHLAELREFHEGKEGFEGISTEEVLNRFIYSRPDGFLEKPIDPQVLMQVIKRILITLEDIKKELIEKLRALKTKLLMRDVEYRGASFSLDGNFLGLISLNCALLNGGVGLPEGFFLLSKEEKVLTFTREEFLNFSRQIRDYLWEVERVYISHMEAIGALKDMESAQAYNIQVGWPSNLL
ncbi:MAG: two-component system response regulator [Desulfatiglandales bacterium]